MRGAFSSDRRGGSGAGRSRSTIGSPATRIGAAVCDRTELRLPRADQLDIDFGQKLGIEQRAVLGAPRIVDRIAHAQIVEPVGAARMLAARQQKRVDDALAADRAAAGAFEFGIEKAEIEHRVVRDQRGLVAKESDQFVDLCRRTAACP